MKLNYTLTIDNPHQHYVKMKVQGKREGLDKLCFFLPSWCPGSYLMREYPRHIRNFRVEDGKGKRVFSEQVEKGKWLADWTKEGFSSDSEFTVEYEVFCHELTVRTSHVDETHAFIHGPTVFIGIEDQELKELELEVKFPALWSKLTTGLKDISTQRDIFLYQAKDYDELLDSPLEIGCHETDGFQVAGKDHHLAFYGEPWAHGNNLKADMKTIVEYVSDFMRDIPYETYTFITHLIPGMFGGLEHLNSTALIFDAKKLGNRKDYVNWLALVAHEYFHTWNVKRIRPRELGPFNYTEENYTRMLWLAEGLTSFLDELFVYRAGLCNIEEYLDMVRGHLDAYLNIPGKKYHSLEDSSFNAWIKLYRPDENSRNSSISYYLKGGLVFLALNVHFHEQGKDMRDLTDLLWESYKKRPELGLTDQEVYELVEEVGGKETRSKFEEMITTTFDIDFEDYFSRMGIGFEWEQEEGSWLGINTEFKGDRIFVQSVVEDGPAHKQGLNAGDEIISINDLRVLKVDAGKFNKLLKSDSNYKLHIARLGRVMELNLVPEPGRKKLKRLLIKNKEQAEKILLAK